MTTVASLVSQQITNQLINQQTWGGILYNVKAYGAKGDGITDDTAAIQATITATPEGGIVLFPDNGVYIISSNLTLSKGITFIGEQCTLRIKNGSRISYILYANATSRLIVRNIIFDMNVQNTVAYQASDYANGSYNEAIRCTGVTERIEISGCKFINLYNESIFLYQPTAPIIRITDNYFTSPAQTQNLRLSHIILQTIASGGNIVIERNSFDNVQPSAPQYGVNAIFLEGVKSQTIIRKNKLNWCGRDNTGTHRLLAIDMYGNCNYVTISDNVVDNCLWGFVRIEASQDVTVERNKFYQNAGILLGDPAIWIVADTVYTQVPQNIKIKSNEFYAYTASRIVNLIDIWTLDWSKVPTNIEISGNSVFGSVDAFVTMMAGLNTVKVDDNRCFAFDGSTPKNLVLLTRTSGIEPINTQASSFSKGLSIRGNHWESAVGPISLDLTSYTGTVEITIIECNKLKGLTGQGDTVTVKNMPVIIRDNYMSNSPEGVQVVGAFKAYIHDNQFDTMDNTPYYLVNATNFIQERNYYNGVRIGEGIGVIAAAGTSVVITHGLGYIPTEIFLTPQGNLGDVWVSTITLTQFTINCSAAPGGNTSVSYIAK